MRRLLELAFLFGLLCGKGLTAESLVLIQYDDGVPEDGMWIGSSSGHAVLFTPPSTNWTLSKIVISGRLNPQSDQNLFVLEIWDENFDLLYSKTDHRQSYFGDELVWAEIDIPDIHLSDNFYVCLFEFSNVFVGADLSDNSSGRSLVVSRNPNRIDSWELPYPRNKTDWSIDALGSSPAPLVDLVLKSSNLDVIIEAMITDQDGDLTMASMQVIDNESLDVLWSEQRQIEGGEANLTFAWPFEMFQITNGTSTLEPIFAFNTIGISPDRGPYMEYLAPCLLKLTREGPDIDAAAYFGHDGEFHALIDASGFAHYMSKELLGIVQPRKSYGDYVKNDMTLIEGEAVLSFFNLNIEKGMVVRPPLMLSRSPLHHYKLGLNRTAADIDEYAINVYVMDSAGNRVSASPSRTA